MGCNSCDNLKEKQKKPGKVNGSVYFCSKKKSYVSGASDKCDNYKKDIMRSSYMKDEIYREGRKYSDDNTSVGVYLVAAIILGIIALILNFL